LSNLFFKKTRNNLTQAKQRLKKLFLGEIKAIKRVASVNADFTVKTGRDYIEITKFAKSKKCNLIVLGAHGEYFLDRLILGSTANNVVKNSNSPVLLVRNKANFIYKKILVPIDFSQVGYDAIQLAYELFPNAEFQLIYVADFWYTQKVRSYSIKYHREKILHKKMRAALLNKMDKFISKCAIDKNKIKSVVKGGYPASVIHDYANKYNIDLVVVGTRGHSKFQYFFIGSVTNKILQLLNKDTLFVPPSSDR